MVDMRTGANGLNFVPPERSSTIIQVSQFLSRAYAKLSPARLEIDIDVATRRQLQTLAAHRAVVCPNHCGPDDPLVVFCLSASLNQKFYYLAAREIFKWHPTLRSLWFQQLGCYSVLRESTDIEAYKATCKLLVGGPNKIVIFPEGEITHQNHMLMDLECGAAHVAFSTACEMLAAGHNDPVYLVPIALVYRYKHDVQSKLRVELSRIESFLGLSIGQLSIQERVLLAFSKMLDVLEAEHHQRPASIDSLAERLNHFRERSIHQIAATLHVDLPAGLNQVECLHLLKKALIIKRFSREEAALADYERALYRQIARATNFISLDGRSFEPNLSQERLAELIFILQKEVTGSARSFAERVVHVSAGELIDVTRFVELFHADKYSAIKALTQQLYTAISEVVKKLEVAHPGRACDL